MNQIILEYRPELHSPPRRSPLIVGNPTNNLTIVPGVKNYEQDKWDDLKNIPTTWGIVESLIEEGVIRIISESSKNETDSTPKLPNNVAQAIALIKKTFSLQLLNLWKESDIRPGVQKAIELQLAEGLNKQEVKEENIDNSSATAKPARPKAKSSANKEDDS